MADDNKPAATDPPSPATEPATATPVVVPVVTPPTDPPKTEGKVDMTQTQLDYEFDKRAKRAASTAIAALLEGMGIADTKALAALVKAHTDSAEADKSDLTKAQEAATSLQEKLTASELLVTEGETKRIAASIDAVIIASAMAASAMNADDVLVHLRHNNADLDEKAIGKDKKIDKVAIDKLVADVKTARTNWFGNGAPGSPSNNRGIPVKPNEAARKAAISAQVTRTKHWF